MLMLQYIENNNLDTDPIMLMLCDDIYICYKTLGTKYAVMFCKARQLSQGNQRLYTVSNIDEIINNNQQIFGSQQIFGRSHHALRRHRNSNSLDNLILLCNKKNIVVYYRMEK